MFLLFYIVRPLPVGGKCAPFFNNCSSKKVTGFSILGLYRIQKSHKERPGIVFVGVIVQGEIGQYLTEY